MKQRSQPVRRLSLTLCCLPALLVLGLVVLSESGAPLLPGRPLADPPSQSTAAEALAVPSPSGARPLYQSPFGSCADDIRLMPLERSLPRAVTSAPAPAAQRS